jgi:hypothetical protein
MFRPDIFPAEMDVVVDHFDPPNRRIGGDGKRGVVCESDHRRTKLFGFPCGSNLRFRRSKHDGRDCSEWNWCAHLADRISNPEGFNFPLLTIRREPQERDTDARFRPPPQDLEQDDNTFSSSVQRHRGRSLRKCSGPCRSLVSVFHLRRWTWSCWSKSRSWSEPGRHRGNTSRSRHYVLSHASTTCARHTFCRYDEGSPTPRFQIFDCGIHVISDLRESSAQKLPHHGFHSVHCVGVVGSRSCHSGGGRSRGSTRPRTPSIDMG